LDEVSPILYVLVVACIAMSAFFSGSETAFATVNKIRMKNLAAEGNKKAEKVLRISEDYDKTLSAILIGNNIVNIASASMGTVICTAFFGANGAWISTIIMTLVVLIFGEITPKTFAKDNAERFSLAVVNVLDLIIKVLSPLAFVFLQLKNCISKKGDAAQPTVTEQELKYIIEESQNEGVLEEQESQLVQSALDFDETTVNEVLTPRVDVVAVDIGEDVEEIKRLFLEEGYSRLPVYQGSIDTILGVIHSKDFFRAYLKNNHLDLHSILQKTVYVPPKKRISELLKELQKLKSHMAIVTDQYGGTIGVITLEDILEELVGDIWDESDEEEVDMVELSDNRYEVSGDLNVEDFLHDIGFEYRESEMEEIPSTFAGWALETFERIPDEGDSFSYKNLTITVKKVFDQRILKLDVQVTEPEESEEK
jgi:putative hemolysin